ncbi:S41 family peptidase [Formicincola oecophyllae]|uniref:S41 family peptidase n=2 Tax=Formicincola oecophyllae TaxID=2558361 RepID=A0A4Y6UCX9_9PROT|nr:S41 family peptidase [Formicincola oecophyllae]
MDIVRAEYVQPMTYKKLINNALNGMVGDLDPHSAYMSPEQFKEMQDEMGGQFGGLGLQIQSDAKHLRIVSPIDGTPAAKAGLKPGEVILDVDGKSVADMNVDQAVKKMRGKPGTKVTLTLLDPKTGKTRTVTLTRQIIHVQVVRAALYGPVAYIRISEFGDHVAKEVRKAWEKLQEDAQKKHVHIIGLVLDVRSDPGGKLDQVIAVCRDFIKQGEIVSIRGRHPENNQHWEAKGRDITHGLPIVVLTNAGSASASEILAGAIKDHHRGLIMGQRTFGKGSVQTIIPIADQGALRLTTARYYTPSGQSIQGHGITPDIPVAESADDDSFYTYHESDLAHVLSNVGSKKAAAEVATLPPAARTIPKEPPKGWPAYDPTNPKTDFQLQQALHLLHAETNTPEPRVEVTSATLTPHKEGVPASKAAPAKVPAKPAPAQHAVP